MIYLIIKTYFSLFLLIGSTSLFLFLTGVFFIVRINFKSEHPQKFQKRQSKNKFQTNMTITVADIQSIAGEDTFATQLDLARAYLETDRKKLAKKILEHVIRKGNFAQQTEARYLLSLI